MAFCHKLGISYLTGYSLLYIGASLLALYAIRQFTLNKGLLLIAFSIILFCPFSYDSIVQMIYNLSFTAPLAIAMISCLVLMYIKVDEGKGKMLVWSILASVNIVAIWLNREDSMWVLPLLVCYLNVFVLVFWNKRRSGERIFTKLLIVFLPMIALILGNATFAYVNYIKYGIYTTNDYTSTNFALAYNNLLKIEQDYFPESCSITKGTLEKAYGVSPTLNKIKPYMDEFYECKSFEGGGREPNDGEIEDGWMNIALRQAASRCGYYDDAITANAFWGRVSEELESAFEKNNLNSRNITFFGSMLHHPWKRDAGYISKWIKSAGRMLWGDISHVLAGPRLIYNSVDQKMKDRYEAITLNYTVDRPKCTVDIAGWVLPIKDTDEYTLRIVDHNGMVLCDMERIESLDIAKGYPGISPNVSKCRFQTSFIITDENLDLYIEIIKHDQPVMRISCENNIEYEDLLYNIDLLEKECSPDVDEMYAKERISIASSIAIIYKFIGPIEVVLFIIGYVYISYKLLRTSKNKKYVYLREWIFQTAIGGCITVLLVAISYIDAFMWGALTYTHTIGVLIDFAGAVAIALDGNIMIKKVRKGHHLP